MKRRSPKAHSLAPRGFAMVIALALMAFIVLLFISLATVTRLEVLSTQNSRLKEQARQNALLGMQIALSELQKYSGPDQIVTAKADIQFPGDDDTLTTDDINAFWSHERNANWTGVWKNGNQTTFDPNDPTAYNADPSLQAWLVSGSEQGLAIDPQSPVTGLSANTAPTDALRDANGNAHQLLVNPVLGSSKRAVTAPLVTVDNGAGTGLTRRYAWWIGDEGVKARVDLVDDYAAGTNTANDMARLASAQRLAIEAMTANPDLDPQDAGLDGFYTPNSERYDELIEASQLYLLNGDEDYENALALRFHDLTTHSMGVLADVKHGGLKQDLSYILGQPNVSSLKQALKAVYNPDADSSIEDPVPDDPSNGNGNTVLDTATTPLAKLPNNISGTGFPFNSPISILAFSPTWEQLWSFYNSGNPIGATPQGAYNTSGQAVPRRSTPEQHGIYPIMTQAKVFYNMEMLSDGTIVVGTKPQVVLANPYAVPLGPADYTLSFEFNSSFKLEVRLGGDNRVTDDGVDPFDPRPINANGTYGSSFSSADRLITVPGNGFGEIQLIIHSEGLAPGEAQVFTVETDTDIPAKSSDQRKFSATLVNDYLPDNAIRYNTGKKIGDSVSGGGDPSRYIYATLYCSKAVLDATVLYLDYDRTKASSEGDRKLIQSIRPKPNNGDPSTPYFVYPMTSGKMEGGGLGWRLFDTSTIHQQQAYFYQINYRTSVIFPSGQTGPDHPLEWAMSMAKKGEPGNEEYFGANLLRASDSLTKVRWGPLHSGEQSYNTVPPPSIAGTEVGFNNYLYDIPRPDVPLASLGQLQHVNTAPLVDRTLWEYVGPNKREYATIVHSWQANYALSNSYAHPRIKRELIFDARGPAGYHFDGSYLWNDVLWDRFYFSTYPASGSFDFNADKLINERYQPFHDSEEVALDDEENFRGDDNDPGNPANSRMAATNLMAKGAFNVNSTSKEAWKAVLSSLRDVPLGNETESGNLTAPFSRTFEPAGGSANAKTGLDGNGWNGFRNLTPDEVDATAEEMVHQVRLRGPFTSMSDFVNRRLVTSAEDPHDLGVSGALQAAIDSTANLETNIASPFDIKSETGDVNILVDNDFQMPSVISGFPGYLLQGDVLSSIGQYLTARSDTFRIRAYGDVLDAYTDKVQARAWCEAIVQRFPDYTIPYDGSQGDQPYEEATDPINQKMGRRYQIIGFRWLSPEEI